MIGVAIDLPASKIFFAKNRIWQGGSNPSSSAGGLNINGLASGPYYPIASLYQSDICTVNFGASPFVYSVPSGFMAVDPLVPLAALDLTSGGVSNALATFAQDHAFGATDLTTLSPLPAIPRYGVNLLPITPMMGSLSIAYPAVNPWQNFVVPLEPWVTIAP